MNEFHKGDRVRITACFHEEHIGQTGTLAFTFPLSVALDDGSFCNVDEIEPTEGEAQERREGAGRP